MNGNKINYFKEFIKLTLRSRGPLWSMYQQAHDATVPFGNFWKAVIFGIINLEYFFFKRQALERM